MDQSSQEAIVEEANRAAWAAAGAIAGGYLLLEREQITISMRSEREPVFSVAYYDRLFRSLDLAALIQGRSVTDMLRDHVRRCVADGYDVPDRRA